MAIYKDQDELLNTDWQAKINEAVASGNLVAAAQYEQARNDKINSSAYTGKVTQTTDNYSQYLQHVGTNYHQNAIDAAAAGNWDDVTKYLGLREDKVAAEGGNNRGKTSAQIYQELMAQYGQQANEPTFDYSSFEETKPTYEESNYSALIDQKLNEILNRDGFTFDQAAPTYNDTYSGRIEDLMSQIENYGKFSYDMANDPLYQQYAEQYQREGKRSMQDTLASVASGAGGMNSYAVTAAQQASDYYNSQLNDRIPELTQLAYEMYLQDFDQKVDQLNNLRSLGETEYNRYRDQYGDYLNERNAAYQLYLDDIERQVSDMGLLQDMDATQYNRYLDTLASWRDDRDFAYGAYRDDMGDYKYDQEWQHQLEQDKLAQENWQQEFDNANDKWQQEFDTSNSQWQQQFDSNNDKWQQEFDTGNSQWQQQFDANNSQWQQEFDSSNSKWQQEFNTSNSQSSSKDAYTRAMDMIKMGVMPDNDLLKAAGISAVAAQGMISSVKKEGEIEPVQPKQKEPEPSPAPVGGASHMTYNDAINTLKAQGVSNNILIGIMDEEEWTDRKASYKAYGIGGDSVALNDTYAEYLENFIEYALSTKK